MFGVGGGVLLVPLLGLLFTFSQHRAQGTSLVALIFPTGLLALMAYSKQGFVSWKTGLLLIREYFWAASQGESWRRRSSREECVRFCGNPGFTWRVAGAGRMVALEGG